MRAKYNRIKEITINQSHMKMKAAKFVRTHWCHFLQFCSPEVFSVIFRRCTLIGVTRGLLHCVDMMHRTTY